MYEYVDKDRDIMWGTNDDKELCLFAYFVWKLVGYRCETLFFVVVFQIKANVKRIYYHGGG